MNCGTEPSVWTSPGAAFQRLGLVQDHVLPLDPLEVLDILDHQLVACDHHMERCVLGVEGFLHTQGESHTAASSSPPSHTRLTWLQNFRITLRS